MAHGNSRLPPPWPGEALNCSSDDQEAVLFPAPELSF